MNCDGVRSKLMFYLYDELAGSEREALEQHVASCESCARSLEQERALLQMMGQRPASEVSATLLAECRHDLRRTVHQAETGRRLAPAVGGGRWAGVARFFGSFRPAWQPTAALALLAIGFVAGRGWSPLSGEGGSASSQPPAWAEPVIADLADIQSVQIDPVQGNVEIVVEEIARRTISGPPQDPRIRGLLLSTLRDDPNSGLRLDTLEVLTRRTEDQGIRAVLVESMVEDEDPSVRLRALEALRPHRADPRVRQALIQVLRRDDNPGMRVQAIEMLTESPDRELVGLLQELVERERNNYIQLQCRRILHELNASVDRF